ncbi:hypothetical protein FHW67_002869 [Herbaspirillum sp. Sphag1AN]|nr:hypothetical protein [Herbaspirillum sp. Sphag1AN]MBB3246769.1 hypothetical protein [Herbaspirillum sp. Sphag64]
MHCAALSLCNVRGRFFIACSDSLTLFLWRFLRAWKQRFFTSNRLLLYVKNHLPIITIMAVMGTELASRITDFIPTMHDLFWRCDYVESP